MREHRDDPKKPSLNIGENYARAERAVASSWLVWLGCLYVPFGVYLAFGVGPIISLLGISPESRPNLYLFALLSEIVVWIGLPFAAALGVYYKLTGNKTS